MKINLVPVGRTPVQKTHLYRYNDNNLWTTNWWALYVVFGLLTLGLVSGLLLIHYLIVTQQHVRAVRKKRLNEAAQFFQNVERGKQDGTYERILGEFKKPHSIPPQKSFDQRFRESNGDLSESDLLVVERAEDERRANEKRSA